MLYRQFLPPADLAPMGGVRLEATRPAAARKGPYYGPFETAAEAVKFLRQQIKARKIPVQVSGDDQRDRESAKRRGAAHCECRPLAATFNYGWGNLGSGDREDYVIQSL